MRDKRLADWRGLAFGGLLVGMAALLAACSGATPGAGLIGAGGGGTPTTYAAAGNGQPPPAIMVSGQGEAIGKPDIAFVELGIDVTDPDVGAAITRANETMRNVQAAISQQGVAEDDMQTVAFNVWPEDRYNDQGELVGRYFHVQNILRVKVRDIGKTGDVIGAGLDAGANSINSLSFSIEDTSALEAEARQKAIADARERAQQLADGLGVRLGAPISVSESSGGVPVYYERAAVPEAYGVGGGAPPISAGQLTVTVYVNVSFAIEQ